MPLLALGSGSALVCRGATHTSTKTLFFFGIFGSLLLVTAATAQNPQAARPNSEPTYQQLRNLTLGPEAFSVNNFELKRDAGTFHLHSGTVCFVAPVEGRVTGAVFVGEGNFILDPPPSEKSMLKLHTKENEFSEKFEHLVLRFTDSTYDDIKKGGSVVSGGCDAGLLKDSQHTMRHRLKHNLEARILEDVLSTEPGGLFVAFIHGKRYNGQELYTIDPGWGGDQVDFQTYDENKTGIWASFPLSGGRNTAPVGKTIHIEHQQLDTTIEKNGNLTGKATTTFVSRITGIRVVPFNLFRTLRVQSVTADGQPLSFIQEDKNDDADFAVVLPKPLRVGEKYTITTAYGGKEAVFNEGGGNYYPVAREKWYPNSFFGDYVSYDMTFRIPKGMKIAATGELVSDNTEGGQNVTVWKSEIPQAVAGFQFGKMKEEQIKLSSPAFVVAAYANEEPPDWATHMQGGTMGNLSTVSMMKGPLSEAQFAIGLYTDYFAPLPFKRLAMTQQSACNYGQSWPELVWLPTCAFYDSTVRHQLGLDWGDRGYWKVVAPHEVAHQWWGQLVGFDSYRDQWMSEGFADFSASLFLQNAYGKRSQKEFHDFWEDERKSIIDKNAMGYRAIDVGPVTMGYRLNNSKAGFNIARDLIYPKGAYILHMVRMMMWDRQTGDQRFKETMQDFVKTYTGKAATTEEFKAMIEKHMTREMDMAGDQKMDWFFDEYVYGIALPLEKLDYSTFEMDASGDVVLAFKITQSGVSDNFRMLVPIYLELANGNTVLLGRAKITGNTSVERKVPLKGVKEKPRRAIMNYYNDVLASVN